MSSFKIHSGECSKAILESGNKSTQLEDSDNQAESVIYKENAWGWVVVLASSYCFGIVVGMINNYALIYDQLIKEFSTTQHNVFFSAWIGSMANGIQFLMCIFGSILVEFYNPRKVGVFGFLLSMVGLLLSACVTELKLYFITYSIVLAVGQAIALSSTLAILPHYFKLKLSLANGLMNAFSSFIVVMLPILTSMILNKFNLTVTFCFLAGMNFFGAIMCLTYKPNLPITAKNASFMIRFKQSFGLKIFRLPKFVVWCIASFFGIFGYLIPIIVMNHHSNKVFPEGNSVLLNTAFAVSGGISSIFFGIIGDYTRFNRVHYHTMLYLVYGLTQISIPFAGSFYVLMAQITILGMMDGIFLCFIVPICCDLVDSPKLSNQAIGYYHAIMAPMTIAGAPFAGKLFEIYSNYNLAFYIGGLSCLICSCILISGILIPEVLKMLRILVVETELKATIVFCDDEKVTTLRVVKL